MLLGLQAANALGIHFNESEEEEEECIPSVQATDVPANASSIQSGLNYFRCGCQCAVCMAYSVSCQADIT